MKPFLYGLCVCLEGADGTLRKSQTWVPRSKILAKGQKLRNGPLGERRVLLLQRPVPGRRLFTACLSLPASDFFTCALVPARTQYSLSDLDPVTVSFPAPFPRIPPLSMPSSFCCLKGLISPAGKNRSAESLTGDRWATFFWPQRGRNGALCGIQIGRSRGSRLLAGPGRPYGACRGGRSRGGGKG